MKTFTSILVATLLIAAFSAKVIKPNVPRRLQDPVTMAAGAAILGKLAENVKISVDANKLVDQLSGMFASQAQDGAIVINMAKDKKGHNLFMMHDFMNMNHLVYNENFCSHGAACHVFKTKLPGSNGKIKVCVDSNWGIPKRTHVVDEGNLYQYDGEGFNMLGSIAKWKAGLANKRRLSTRRLSPLVSARRLVEAPATPSAGVKIMETLAGNTGISVDANKLVDQLSGLFASQAQDGAVVINMAKDKKGHNLFMMPDFMNMNHSVFNENFCSHGSACNVYKTKMPGSSGKIKVCVDSNWGIPKRTHIVEEGNLYQYDGEGFNMIGNVAEWKKGLANKRRLSTRRLSTRRLSRH